MLSRRRLLTLAALLPISSQVAYSQSKLQCPVLMYHQIADLPPQTDPFYNLYVTPQEFTQHLDLLVTEGYTSITLHTLLDGLVNGTTLPEKPIVLTFDDGYENAYSQAYPLLSARSMGGTVFVITTAIGSPGYLTWEQAADLQTNGIEIGCHTATHASLRGLDAEALEAEVTGATGTIQEALGTQPVSFCYPYGHFDRAAQRKVKECGYLGAVTTQNGIVTQESSLYQLPRVRIRTGLSDKEFLWLVAQS